VSDGAT